MHAEPLPKIYVYQNRVRITVSIRVRISFTTGAVRSAIPATAGLLVHFIFSVLAEPIAFGALTLWLGSRKGI